MEGLAFRPGDVIAKKYRIERVLGRGGMGVVLAAHHVQLDERVAIKVLAPEVKETPEAVQRFVREARAAVRIRSEHVVRVLDVGELDDGTPYMVMEFLEGTDLASELAKGPLALEVVLDYVLQASEALAEAHKNGVVHRDLKPANLFLTRRADGSPLVKLLDFGISKAQSSNEGGLTRTAVFMGSPHYAPPEQLMSARNADARSDIWALGVILYEALAGHVPFQGESVMEIAARILQMSPAPLSAVRPDVPKAFSDVVMRCLDKKPENRFDNIAAFARALGPFAARSRRSVERISGIIGDSAPSPADADADAARPAAGGSAAPAVKQQQGPPALSPPQSVPGLGFDTQANAGIPRRSSAVPWLVVAGVILVGGGGLALSRARSRTAAAEGIVSTASPTTQGPATVNAPAIAALPTENLAPAPKATEAHLEPAVAPPLPEAAPKRTRTSASPRKEIPAATASVEPTKVNPLHVETK